MPRLKAILLSLATMCAPVALAQTANPAVPGTVNYVEGSASIEGRMLNQRSVGSAQLEPGQVLETANGRAEVLLTPGVFLRVGENSAVRMVSPDLLNTRVEVDRGRADIEVDEIHPRNNIEVTEAGANTRLLKNGFYAFDADKHTVRVFKGEAELIETGDVQKQLKLKGDRQVALAGSEAVKSVSFDRDQAEDSLYSWSSLRSQYLAEANINLASQYAGYGGWAPGWYWDAGFWGYTWLPGDGLLWSPFGWGFYSPRYIYYGGPIFYGGRGFGRGYVQSRGYAGSFHGEGFSGGGVHSMGRGFHGGRG
jgi:FecR protein